MDCFGKRFYKSTKCIFDRLIWLEINEIKSGAIFEDELMIVVMMDIIWYENSYGWIINDDFVVFHYITHFYWLGADNFGNDGLMKVDVKKFYF